MANDELETLLDMLFEHKAEYVRSLLKEYDLKISGTKPELRERIENTVARGTITPESIVALLNKIEGWGKQHIYLYSSPQSLRRWWQDENNVRGLLNELGSISLLNSEIPIVLPEERELATIMWNSNRIRFMWITRLTWDERLEDRDIESEEENIIWKAYIHRTGRGVLAFDWNLISGIAMLMIRSLPTLSMYKEVKRELMEFIRPYVDLNRFEPVPVSTSIKALENSNEVRRRQLLHETVLGSQARYTSRGRRIDTTLDPDIQQSLRALGDNTIANLGNFYWLPNNNHLTKEVHTIIYSNEERIGILGEHLEKEVRYVIGRIQSYCQRSS